MQYTGNKDNIVPYERYAQWKIMLFHDRLKHKGYLELWPFDKVYYYIR